MRHYDQVCKSYQAIDDFRAKLLGILPFVSGAGGLTVLTSTALRDYLTPVGAFGAIITAGLAIYEAKGAYRCKKLKEVARKLEEEMGMKPGTGQFLSQRDVVFGFIREGVASAVVYIAVTLGWISIAVASKLYPLCL